RMAGAGDALQRVTAHAIGHEALLRVGAGPACQPFGAGELGDEVAGLLELDVGRNGLVGGDVCGRLAVKVITDRPDGQGIRPRNGAVGGEAVAALVVRYRRDRDGGFVSRRRHSDAAHRPFLGGANFSRERSRALSPRHAMIRDDRDTGQQNGGKMLHAHGVLSRAAPRKAGRDMAAYREIVTKERRGTVSHGQAPAALRTLSWTALRAS